MPARTAYSILIGAAEKSSRTKTRIPFSSVYSAKFDGENPSAPAAEKMQNAKRKIKTEERIDCRNIIKLLYHIVYAFNSIAFDRQPRTFFAQAPHSNTIPYNIYNDGAIKIHGIRRSPSVFCTRPVRSHEFFQHRNEAVFFDQVDGAAFGKFMRTFGKGARRYAKALVAFYVAEL